MNYDIFADTDSFTAIVEKEQAAKIDAMDTTTVRLIQEDTTGTVVSLQQRKCDKRKWLKNNVEIPIIVIAICVLLTFCFNSRIVDYCGCSITENIESDRIEGIDYFQCVSSRLFCYSNIEYNE